MQLFQDFLDRSKQLNQTPAATAKLPYHAPKHHYKFIYQGLILPNLPAPLHYLNFIGLLGSLNTAMLRPENVITTSALDTASILCSSSPLQSIFSLPIKSALLDTLRNLIFNVKIANLALI